MSVDHMVRQNHIPRQKTVGSILDPAKGTWMSLTLFARHVPLMKLHDYDEELVTGVNDP